MIPLAAILAVLSREREARIEQAVELSDAYQGTAMLLGDVVEADDAPIARRCRSVWRWQSCAPAPAPSSIHTWPRHWSRSPKRRGKVG